MLLGNFDILFYEVSVQSFVYFFSWVTCFFLMDLHEFFIYLDMTILSDILMQIFSCSP